MEILKVLDLRTYFNTPTGEVKAVDGISFSLQVGETMGIVGESGAGKSVTALTVMGLAREMGARHVSGEVWFRGVDLFTAPQGYMGIRGHKIALIPQESGDSLNPVLTVGEQLEELLKVHLGLPARERKKRIIELLEAVELPDPRLTAGLYSYQLSGGMLQRVLLAMALACDPEIVVADEPASALDTTIQAEILKLLKVTGEKRGLAMILISHDLGIISQNCDRVLVMFGGRLMESGPTAEVFGRPFHPYTETLLTIYRALEDKGRRDWGRTMPLSSEPAGGCVFMHRCARATDLCGAQRPAPLTLGDTRVIACHRMLG